ncbi:MAG: hypothetical protein DME19_15635 [Verrucomicrobia bacterium]|nr:MAG: hypothetical protein DME19_15635 [Verrucomicrobiota bacterium]
MGTFVIVFVVCGASRRSYAQEGNWDERFGLPNLGSVFTLGLTDDGKLYTGGSFPGNAFGAGGGLNANSICAWNGSHWLRLGDDAVTNGTSGSVFAIATVGSAVYAGGDFGAVNDLVAGRLGVNSVAKWEGNQWSRLGNDTDYGVVGQVYALAADGTNVYVGGRFFRAGGVNTTNIAKWDGRQWSALGSGLGNGQTDRVTAIALGPDGSVYAAGNFTNSASVALNRIAKWDGANWTPLGSGVDDLVFALTLKDGELYAGGQFLSAGGNTAKRLAKWDGSQWTEVGGGITDGPVYSLTTSSNDLFVGGDFTAGGSTPLSGVGKWDGSSWSDLGGGVRTGNSGAVYSAGGQFARAGSLAAFGVAKWDGQSWSALNKALVGDQLTEVNAIAIQGTNVFVGGEFTSAGGIRANRLAVWDGYNWSALSSGSSNEFDQQVLAVAVAHSGDVYAGGKFFWAGGTIVHGIAKWDGAS